MKWLRPNGLLEKKFVDLYLDSSKSRDAIIKNLKISPATFYRLVKDSEIPSFNVGVLTDVNVPSTSSVHWQRFFEKKTSPGLSHHIEVAMELGPRLGKRFDFKFLSSKEVSEGLQKDKLQLAVASITKTMGRHPGVEISDPYLFKGKPHGGIFVLKEKVVDFQNKVRPILGVAHGSLHQHALPLFFGNRFRVISYSFGQEQMDALNAGRIDGIFTHPHYVEDPTNKLVMIAGPFDYGGHTGVAIASAYPLLKEVNHALDVLYEENFLQKLDERY